MQSCFIFPIPSFPQGRTQDIGEGFEKLGYYEAFIDFNLYNEHYEILEVASIS